MNEMHSFVSRAFSSRMSGRASVLLFTLVLSGFAFGGEIHDATKAGDLERVKALLKDQEDIAELAA